MTPRFLPLALALLTTTASSCFYLEEPADAPDEFVPEDPVEYGSSVADACPDEVVAPPGSDEVQLRAWTWLGCYRSLVGLDTPTPSSELHEATSTHAAYMMETGEYGMVETDSNAIHFRGYDTLDRLSSAGLDVDLSNLSVYETVTRVGEGGVAEPEPAIDNWVNTVYHRPPLLRPLVDYMGVGFDERYADLVSLGPWDTVDREGGTLTARYPAPGQGQVPTTFYSDREFPDPVADLDAVGSPISVTFQADFWHDNNNHFDVHLVAEGCAVYPVDGEPVPLILLEPETDAHLWSTVVLLPSEPLEPYETYVVEIEVEVGGAPWLDRWSFTTGEE
jgi:hypothetical protein